MTVKELIDKLMLYQPGLEVSITDGNYGDIYEGNFSVQLFTDLDGKQFVDIGIGGCEVENL